MKRALIIVSLFGLFGTSCKKPKACIEVDKATAGRKQKITLTATCSTNANNFAWDFDNGVKAQGDSATVSYYAKGTYNVVLTVFSRSGKTNSTTQVITVN